MQIKRKLTNFLKLGVLFFGVLLLWNCEKEDTLVQEDSIYKTVSVQESIDFLKRNKSGLYQKRKNQRYAVPFIEKITYEEIIDSDELLAVIPAITVYKKHYSRILLLKINNEIQSVVFSMYSNKKVNTDKFSGEVIITDLNGKFISGYKIYDGVLISEYKKKTRMSKSSKYLLKSNERCPNGHGDEDPHCIFNMQELDETDLGTIRRFSINIPYIFLQEEQDHYPRYGRDSGGNYDEEWNYGGGGGGNLGNSDITVDGPKNPIANMTDYLKCFDLNLGATITIYIDQPVANSDRLVSIGDRSGHTFVSISQNGYTSTFGFYPNGTASPFSPTKTSVMGDDSQSPYDVSVSVSVNSDTLKNVVNSSINYNSTYNLNDYNCTDFIIEIGNQCGLNLPDANRNWLIGGGSNPASLGQHIRNNFSPTGSQGVNTAGGTSPSNVKNCEK